MLGALCGPENVANVLPHNLDRTFQRAALHLKLANIVTKMKEGGEIPDDELKSITSGEPVTAEKKFCDPFEFAPYSTFWLASNHLPRTRDFSAAFFRRALVIPFNNTFTAGENADPSMEHGSSDGRQARW